MYIMYTCGLGNANHNVTSFNCDNVAKAIGLEFLMAGCNLSQSRLSLFIMKTIHLLYTKFW